MKRFFLPPEEFDAPVPTLHGPEAHHATRVLRLKTGDIVEVFDGLARSVEARIVATGKQTVELRFTGPIRTESPPRRRIVLAQALLRREKMKLVLQKAVELGADEIWPFVCTRSVARAGGDTVEAERERNLLVVLDALKQCRSNRLPSVSPPLSLNDVFSRAPRHHLKLFLWERERARGLKDLAERWSSPEGVVMVVGPEGGFTADEAALAEGNGFLIVTLGERILRAETAAIAGLALAQYLWGNLGGRAEDEALRENFEEVQGQEGEEDDS